MARAVAVAVARSIAVLFAVSVAVFWATELLPSDAAQTRAGGGATAGQLAGLRGRLGLDRPAWERYATWLGRLGRGDAGTSLVTGRPVGDVIAERLPATLALAGCGLAVALPLMLLLAWLAGAAPPRLRGLFSALVIGLAAVPQVVFAAGLVALLAGALAWLPPVSLLSAGESPFERPELLILPTLSLAVPAAAFGAGLLGGAVADTVRRPHVTDAAARGLPPWLVAVRHVTPFLLAPAARVVAMVMGGLLAATALVETMFGYVGMGELLISAVATRDAPVVQAVGMLTAAVVLAGLLAADALAALTDPDRRSRA
jgi:peptide/nickel transport system permease protein